MSNPGGFDGFDELTFLHELNAWCVANCDLTLSCLASSCSHSRELWRRSHLFIEVDASWAGGLVAVAANLMAFPIMGKPDL